MTDQLQWIKYGLAIVIFGLAGVILIRWRLGKILRKSDITLKTLPHRVGEVIFSAIIVFGLGVILGETGLLAKIYHRELFRNYVEKISDAGFLRETLTPMKLKQLRLATTEATLGKNLPKGPGSFFYLLENTIFPMLDQPWRENLEVYYNQEVQELRGIKVLHITQTMLYTLKNPFDTPIEYSWTIKNTISRIPGLDPKSLLTVPKFKVNGEMKELMLKMEPVGDHDLYFLGTLKIEIKDSVFVEYRMDKLLPYQSSYIYLWVEVPTQNIKFTYKYPETFSARGVVLGLFERNIMTPELGPGLSVWEYKGWLFAKHGLFIYWNIPQ